MICPPPPTAHTERIKSSTRHLPHAITTSASGTIRIVVARRLPLRMAARPTDTRHGGGGGRSPPSRATIRTLTSTSATCGPARDRHGRPRCCHHGHDGATAGRALGSARHGCEVGSRCSRETLQPPRCWLVRSSRAPYPSRGSHPKWRPSREDVAPGC